MDGLRTAGYIYLGSASYSRKGYSRSSGACLRWLEHTTGKLRPLQRDSGAFKYRLARKYPAFQPTFLVLREGPERLIRVLEALLIKSLAPNANGWGKTYALPKLETTMLGYSERARRNRPLQSRRRKCRVPRPAVQDSCVLRRVMAPGSSGPSLEACWASPPSNIKALRSIQSSWIWTAKYSKVLDVFRALCDWPTGPVDMRRPEHWPLLVLWMTLPTATLMTEELSVAWGVEYPEIMLASTLLLPLGRLRQQRLRHCINAALTCRGLTGTRGIAIQLPHAELIPVTRLHAKRLLTTLLHDHVLVHWCLRQLRIVRARAPMHKDDYRASKKSKTVDASHVCSLAHDDVMNAIQLVGATKVKGRTDVRKRCTNAQLHTMVCEALGTIARKVANARAVPNHVLPNIAQIRRHPAVHALNRMWSSTAELYEEHNSDMDVPSHCVGVGDDKDRASGWILDRSSFEVAVFAYITNSANWNLTDLAPSKSTRKSGGCHMPTSL